MNETIHEYYIEAGKIAASARNEAISRVRADVPLIEIAEFAENRIRELGGKPAFPCNISVNEIASHYTPEDGAPCFKKGDVVKIDVGVHIEGYIADTASTIEIGTDKHCCLIKACEEALGNAITSTKDGIQTRTIGKIIESTIKRYGFNPIRDLTGHSLERYDLHSGITVPNYGSVFSQKMKKDMVFAIEPFATYGKGDIRYGKSHIFALTGRTKVSAELRKSIGCLPFSRRWIPGIRMEDLRGLREYHELIEKSNEIVAQAEHTVIVHPEGCEIIT
ncbi:MAG: type II methionyl aminopeptidase [Candidatus Methanoperedens sp.]|nr:type II methionyl aminopeptidase [Candidatus Methanoperedens sp.]MCZ7369191.1 type II methionyl aminopeptidase [Candidatus Methanoperedens sp.]